MVEIIRPSRKPAFIQVAVTLLANWVMINNGMVVGFPSAVLPPLLRSTTALHASINQASWIASLSFISALMASLVAGPLIDCMGRARGLQLVSLVFALGWCVMAVWPLSLHSLYVGRLLTGAGMGLASCAAAAYTAEVATPHLRTALVTLSPLMLATGTFFVYLWALFYQDSWSEVSFFGLGISVFSVLLTPLLPESPMWLLSRGCPDRAQQQLMKLRGASCPEQVLEELQSYSIRKREESSWFTTLKHLSQPQAYKPLLILNIFFFFQQVAGVGIVIQFGVDFTRDAGIKTQTYMVALGIATVRTFSALLTSWTCSIYGKRVPALVSGAVMSTSVLSLAAVSHFFPSPWLSGALILIYVLSSSVGFSTLPWSMLGELYPTNVRGVASGITVCLVFVESFIGSKVYYNIVLSFGSFYVYSFFGISGFIGTIFIYLFLPETHGKTLTEIEEYFKGSKMEEKEKEIGMITIS